VADEIADRTDLIGFIVGDFHAESILDRDHQFEAVEPVGPEIFGEVRVVAHVLDRDPQMLGDESANFPGGNAVFHNRRSVLPRRASHGHDEPPIPSSHCRMRPGNPPFNMAQL
jgi:hypothetical protein